MVEPAPVSLLTAPGGWGWWLLCTLSSAVPAATEAVVLVVVVAVAKAGPWLLAVGSYVWPGVEGGRSEELGVGSVDDAVVGVDMVGGGARSTLRITFSPM